MSLKDLRNYLGKPAYETDDVLIYPKDSLGQVIEAGGL